MNFGEMNQLTQEYEGRLEELEQRAEHLSQVNVVLQHKIVQLCDSRDADENKFLHIEQQLEQSTKIVVELQGIVTRQSDIIAKLVCGLFNNQTQKNYRKLLLDVLEGEESFVEMDGPDSSRWDQDPTTSQGDFLEERTEHIEDMTENLTVRLNRLCLRVADIEDNIKK